MNYLQLTILLILLSFSSLLAQEQSRESMAVDATASQWSYQCLPTRASSTIARAQ